MSEAVIALDADLARTSAAQQQLAAALSHEHPSATDTPSDVERARAAVRAAEAALAQAEAAVHADQAAASGPTVPHDPNHFVNLVA